MCVQCVCLSFPPLAPFTVLARVLWNAHPKAEWFARYGYMCSTMRCTD